MTKTVAPSYFSYISGSVIRDTTIGGKPQDENEAAGEKIVIKVLQKHGFLTRRLMERNLDAFGHRSIDLTKTLRKMQQRGIVKKYTIFPDTGDNISIHFLSDKVRQRYPDLSGYRYDMTDIAYIMEHLAIAQWEIGLLTNKTARECMYEKVVRSNDRTVRIPCLHRFKNTFDRNIHIAAVPVSRSHNPDGLRKFLVHLDDIRAYLEDNSDKYKSSQIVIICESMRQIEDVCRMLSRIIDLSAYYFLYSTDAITSDTDPFSMLYGAEYKENGNVELSLISLKSETFTEAAARAVSKVRNITKEVIDRYSSESMR